MATKKKRTKPAANGEKAIQRLSRLYRTNDYAGMKETLAADWPKVMLEVTELLVDAQVLRRALENELSGITNCPMGDESANDGIVKLTCTDETACRGNRKRQACWVKYRVIEATMQLVREKAAPRKGKACRRK